MSSGLAEEDAGEVGPSAVREDLLVEAERLIASLRAHPDPAVGEQVDALLEDIDVVHRTGLTRLLARVQSMAGDAFIHRLCSDPAVRLLLMSYDLVAVDRRLMAEEALDPVRAHLHAHGVDIELADVVGGVVYVRLHPPPSNPDVLAGISRDLEQALRAGLPGFQEVETADRHARGSALVQMGEYRGTRKPVYRAVLDASELDDGRLHVVDVAGDSVVLARVDGDVCAVANRCGDSPLPLEFSTLEGSELVCSWHGCRYDLRTGHRVDGRPDRLSVYPVRVEGGRVEVAVTTEAARPGPPG